MINFSLSRLWSNGKIEQITSIGLDYRVSTKLLLGIPKNSYFNDTEGTLCHVLETGELRFGSDIKQPMFYQVNGTFTGSEYDLSLAIVGVLSEAYGINITAKWVVLNYTGDFFLGMFAWLDANACDVLFTYMSNTPDRTNVTFSIPYSPQSFVSLIRGGSISELNFTTLADFNRKNIIIEMRAGTLYDIYWAKYLPNTVPFHFNRMPDRGYSNLLNVHAIIDDIQPIAAFIRKNPNLPYFTSDSWKIPEPTPFFAIASRKDEVIIPVESTSTPTTSFLTTSNPTTSTSSSLITSTSEESSREKPVVVLASFLGIMLVHGNKESLPQSSPNSSSC